LVNLQLFESIPVRRGECVRRRCLALIFVRRKWCLASAREQRWEHHVRWRVPGSATPNPILPSRVAEGATFSIVRHREAADDEAMRIRTMQKMAPRSMP